MVTLNARQFDAPSTDGLRRSHPYSRTEVVAELSMALDEPPAVLLTSSCTHALEASALLINVGPGDEVIVPAFTFPSTANAFLLRGATVRFADVSDHDGNIDPTSVETRLSERTRAIVAVHYAGIGADLDLLEKLAERCDAVLIEDAAHGIHARSDGVPLGRRGTFGCLSFHRTKNLTAGDGGALIVNDPDLIAPATVALDKGTNREAFDAGRVDAYDWRGLGSSWHLPDTGVDLLGESLARSSDVQATRQHVWRRYMSELQDWAKQRGVTLPSVSDNNDQPAHLFWVGLPDAQLRTKTVDHCRDLGVEVARHFGSLPESPYGATIAVPGDECPVAKCFADRLLRLPMHHQLSDDDTDRVIQAITTAPI